MKWWLFPCRLIILAASWLLLGCLQSLFGFSPRTRVGNSPLKTVCESGRGFRKDSAADWTMQSGHFPSCFWLVRLLCYRGCCFSLLPLKILRIVIELPQFWYQSKDVALPSTGWRCRFHCSTARNPTKKWLSHLNERSLVSAGSWETKRPPGGFVGLGHFRLEASQPFFFFFFPVPLRAIV